MEQKKPNGPKGDQIVRNRVIRKLPNFVLADMEGKGRVLGKVMEHGEAIQFERLSPSRMI